MKITPYAWFFMLALAVSCKKDPEIVTFTDNTIPPYSEVSTLLVENYVNRLYIDLIGREPTDGEMSADVAALEAGQLSAAARTTVVYKLMNNTAYIEGDSSYAHAYHLKFYDDQKARFLNGASEVDMYESYYLYYYISVQDSIAGNMLASQLNRAEANKMRAAIESNRDLRLGTITVSEMCRRMCFNAIYDDINMNTFNYINATFDNLYFRFPTEAELDAAYAPVDYNGSGVLFGQVINSKTEYLNVLLNNAEFAEGMIRWAYSSLLSREPQTIEVFNLLDDFNNGENIEAVQISILITDEYAGF